MPLSTPAVHVEPWRAPSTADPEAVDAVWVARGPVLVLLRSSLTRPIGITPDAWAHFISAVKRGEFDDIIGG